MKKLATLLFIFCIHINLSAQQFHLLDPSYVNFITQEISGDAAYEHMRFMTQFHRPGGGADGLWEVAIYIEKKAKEFGLDDVLLIKQHYRRPPWNARLAELWLMGDRPIRLASTLQTPLHLADYSSPTDVTAEIVYIGSGTSDTDYKKVDVRGKIVLTHGNISLVMRKAVWNRGALGIIWYPDPIRSRWMSDHDIGYPDQIHWSRVPLEGPQGENSTFAFILSLRQGLELRNKVTSSPSPLKVHAYVDASFDSKLGDEPWQVMVEASITGTEPNLAQDIIITAHIQEEKFSANDNASGSASILEIARALNRLITEEKILRPRRTIRFWWVREFASQRQYFADNPDAHERMWVNINQDMVGANQAQDVLRVQNITRLPASRFHFFNDVTEAVIEYMVTINNTELAELQARELTHQTDPIYAHLGTRHRYNAKMIFFHGNTDHMTFNETPIGVPGITFTNWPDNYIHTSDDDLWNIDRTQLERNAIAGALIAYTMGSAGSDSFHHLAAETAGRGTQRIAYNLYVALNSLATGADKYNAYLKGIQQIEYAAKRERKALLSLQPISHEIDQMHLDVLIENLEGKKQNAVREIERHYFLLTGQDSLPEIGLTGTERSLSEIIPVITGGPQEFLHKRGELSTVRSLHNLMAFEIINLINGERTGLDIYRFVAAQAREAGEHYYGVVTPEAVLEYIEKVIKTELVGIRE